MHIAISPKKDRFYKQKSFLKKQWSLGYVLLTALVCFLVGRYTVSRNMKPVVITIPADNSGPVQFASIAEDTLPLNEAIGSQAIPNDTFPGPQQFNQLLEDSKLNQRKPPVKPTSTGNPDYQLIPFQVLSWYPRIILYPNFIDKDRCDYVINMASSRLTPSTLALRKGEKRKKQSVRTSKGTFIGAAEDKNGVLAWIENRIAAVTHIPRYNGEAFNVLRYEEGQHYESHMDYFDPKLYNKNFESNRVATMLLYLSECAQAGQTVFPRQGIDGPGRQVDYKRCDGYYSVRPRKGDAILFYSVFPNNTMDIRATHGGCPVGPNSSKWVMTKWIRDQKIH